MKKNKKIEPVYHEITESNSVGSIVEINIKVTEIGSYFEEEAFSLNCNNMTGAWGRDEQKIEVLWHVLTAIDRNQPEALKLIDAVRNKLLKD